MLPKSMLVDTVTVYEPTLVNGRASVSEVGRTINGVCFQRANVLVNDAMRLTEGPRGTLFVDATTKGAFEIKEGSKVVVNGLEPMQAVSVAPFYKLGTLHHWEISVQ